MIDELRGSGERVTLLFDERCGVCIWIVSVILRHASAQLHTAGIGSATGEQWLGDLPAEERWKSWHAIDSAGRRHSGGAALPVLLGTMPGGQIPATLTAALPSITDRGYGFVARHRRQWSRLVPSHSVRRARYELARLLSERAGAASRTRRT
jgi:predicted DCC family thiol-disulfide oxidoreductase YuxK